MSETNEPAGNAEDKPSDEKIPLQRKPFASKRQAAAAAGEARPELEEKLAHLVDSVKVLQSHIAGGNTGDDVPTDGEPKTRRMKRFQKSAGDEASETQGAPELDHEVRGDETTLNKNIAWPRLARLQAAPASVRSRGADFGRRHPFLLWVLVQIAGFALLLLGYWLGQGSPSDDDEHSAPTEAASPTKNAAGDLLARVGINDRALEAADQGLLDEKGGKRDAAREIWESAVAGRVNLPGAEYRLAMLDIERADYNSADVHLTNSLAAGEKMASCYFVNACFAGRNSNYPEAARQLAHAVKVEPFNAKYLFCFGEALRRAGKAQEAVGAITQALDRPATSADVELFNFKLRLAKIEAGHDDAFEAELADHLAKQPITGDWLLLAAAHDLAGGAFPAAAGHLKDAARALTPDAFDLLVQDFAFQGYVNRKEVGDLLKVPAPPASTGPMDPGAWPAEEADPAVWPPFAPAL